MITLALPDWWLSRTGKRMLSDGAGIGYDKMLIGALFMNCSYWYTGASFNPSTNFSFCSLLRETDFSTCLFFCLDVAGYFGLRLHLNPRGVINFAQGPV